MTSKTWAVWLALCACGVTERQDGTDGGGGAPDGPAGGKQDAGPGGGGSDINRSGTRIKLRFITTADGAKVYNNMFDTQRNEDCVSAMASDGITRCLPIFAGAAAAGYFYGDAGCTVVLAYTAACQARPSRATISVPLCDVIQYRIFAIGAEFAGTTYTKSGARCEPSTPPGYSFYTLGSEIPASSFAATASTIE